MLAKWGGENEFSEELVVVQLRCLCWGQTEVKSREVREGLKARQRQLAVAMETCRQRTLLCKCVMWLQPCQRSSHQSLCWHRLCGRAPPAPRYKGSLILSGRIFQGLRDYLQESVKGQTFLWNRQGLNPPDLLSQLVTEQFLTCWIDFCQSITSSVGFEQCWWPSFMFQGPYSLHR